MIVPRPIIQSYDGINVVRDDLVLGGTKTRFLPALIGAAPEVVYGGPFCGAAGFALAIVGREMGRKVTLFYAKRKLWHRFQKGAAMAGARIVEVPFGYMSNVQAKARAYAAEVGALFLPLGFDLPEAAEALGEPMRDVRALVGHPHQVWCAAGSGMLARHLAVNFPNSEICAVTVGLESRNSKQAFPPNVRILPSGYKFEQEGRVNPPFPAAANYERKAWELMIRWGNPNCHRLFWNVLG